MIGLAFLEWSKYFQKPNCTVLMPLSCFTPRNIHCSHLEATLNEGTRAQIYPQREAERRPRAPAIGTLLPHHTPHTNTQIHKNTDGTPSKRPMSPDDRAAAPNRPPSDRTTTCTIAFRNHISPHYVLAALKYEKIN